MQPAIPYRRLQGRGQRSGSPQPTSQADDVAYIALCNHLQHAGGAGDGVLDGRWVGVCSANLDDAEGSALAHEDGFAFVAIDVNGVLRGPVTRP